MSFLLKYLLSDPLNEAHKYFCFVIFAIFFNAFVFLYYRFAVLALTLELILSLKTNFLQDCLLQILNV